MKRISRILLVVLALLLVQLGAIPVSIADLDDIPNLLSYQVNFFDQ